jgi:hypothetical protein
MPRKKFVEAPVDDPLEEVVEVPDDVHPEESNPDIESQKETSVVKPKTVKQLEKEAAKRAKEQISLDMKARVKCPICRRTVSQWTLLYKHTCAKANLEKRPKPVGVAELPGAPEPIAEPIVEPIIEEEEPPSPEWTTVKRRVRTKPEVEVREYEPEPRDTRYYEEFPPLHEQLRSMQRTRQYQQATKMVSPIRSFYNSRHESKRWTQQP